MALTVNFMSVENLRAVLQTITVRHYVVAALAYKARDNRI